MSKNRSTGHLAATDNIENLVHVIRGQRVMLDFDLARLYGVTTKALNQAVWRNADRFPDDFAYLLTRQELTNLKSQIVTSSAQTLTEQEVTALKSHIATSSLGHGGARKLPWAFTEHGVAMLSSVLRSPMAAKVNIEIMRAFVRLRRLMAAPGELVEQLNRLAETVQLHDVRINAIAEVLQRMMEPPAEPKRRIGFPIPREKGQE